MRLIIRIWVRTNVFFWSLYVWITSLDFSYVCDVSECLISSTNRELKIRMFSEILSIVISSNIRFFNKSFITFLRDSTNVRLDWSSWRKTIMFATFWYLESKRFARTDLVRNAKSNSKIDLVINARLFSNPKLFRTLSSSLIRNDFVTIFLKSIESDDNSNLHVSSSMLKSLNDSVHLSRFDALSSRHINTSELRDRSWIELTFESFRIFSASTICFSTRNFLTSVIDFSIIFARWVIDDVDEFMTWIRE
jgi:hypothetical protein